MRRLGKLLRNFKSCFHCWKFPNTSEYVFPNSLLTNLETLIFSSNTFEDAPLVVSGELSIPPNTQLRLRFSEKFSEDKTLPLIKYGSRTGAFSGVTIDMQSGSEDNQCDFTPQVKNFIIGTYI